MNQTAEQHQEAPDLTEVNNAVLALVEDRQRVAKENKALQGQLALAHQRIHDLETGRDD